MMFVVVMMEAMAMCGTKMKMTTYGSDDNVRNGNDEEAPNNVAIGGDVQASFEGLQNDILRQSEEVPVQQQPQINIPEGLNENLNQGTAPQLEGATDSQDEMPLGGIFCPNIYRTAPPIGPTLVMLGNARKNGVRRPPKHQTVVRNNCSIHGLTRQSNNPRPYSANNGAMACIEQPKSSYRGSR